MQKISYYVYQTTLKDFQIITVDSLTAFTVNRLFDRTQISGQQHNFPLKWETNYRVEKIILDNR